MPVRLRPVPQLMQRPTVQRYSTTLAEGGERMGKRGPAPKRSDQVRRRNAGENDIPVTQVPRMSPEPVKAPPLMFTTHPLAMEWYFSLSKSAQSQYFEESDWAAAQVVCMEMGRMLNAGKPSGQMFTAIWAAVGDLLSTEGQRRRLRFEIDRATAVEDDGDDASILSLAERLRQAE